MPEVDGLRDLVITGFGVWITRPLTSGSHGSNRTSNYDRISIDRAWFPTWMLPRDIIVYILQLSQRKEIKRIRRKYQNVFSGRKWSLEPRKQEALQTLHGQVQWMNSAHIVVPLRKDYLRSPAMNDMSRRIMETGEVYLWTCIAHNSDK